MGSDSRYQLHFFELVLTNQTSCISPVTTRFTPKAGSMCSKFQAILAELGILYDPIPQHVGHWHFRCRNEVIALFTHKLERIFGKFRKLTRSV